MRVPSDLTSYAELATVLASLPLILREMRRVRQLSQRAAAGQMGLSFATISRVEAGGDMNINTAIAIMRWIDHPPVPAEETR